MEDRFTKNPRAHDLWTRGNRLFDGGNPGAAIEAFQDALRLDPGFAEAWNSLGIAHYEGRDYIRAAEDYKKAVLLKPDFSEALSNLGTAFLFMGRYPDAAAAFEQVVALQPDMPEAHNNLGLVYEQMARTDDAVRHYRRFLELWDGNTRYRLAVQERLDRLGRGKRSGVGDPPDLR